ncbi:uncharacterized protein LOC125225877 isoform X3 [Leguminivora glycinivorella]|uniref:uncharacterized protein LOC125225877 isoform X3 n=1 Tax=Leguminivora glycinivorella TaxID=1035111 RepID=UPI00200C8A3F|nr:uncharacterized protein LOC125225877 isoform X3 [Leguminivora glycinivorella]
MSFTSICCISLIFVTLIKFCVQDCPQEESQSGFKVTWPSSSLAENATSQPLCFRNERLITRNCNGTHWEPSYEQLQACQQIVNYFGYSKCPPGHHQISENSGHCYQINKRSAWNHPCYKSGKTTVITDLEESEIFSLLTSLNATKHKYFWLPAQRSKVFNPVVWHVPGPNWGRTVETNTKHSFLQMRAPMMKNCLLLNVEQRTVITETCSLEYPSLCFSVNEFRYPLGCPDRYYGFRFMSDDNICYGIEESDNETGLTYDEFVNTKCSRPSPRTYQGLHVACYAWRVIPSHEVSYALYAVEKGNVSDPEVDSYEENLSQITIDVPNATRTYGKIKLKLKLKPGTIDESNLTQF